jgi:hypothetical protein
MAAFEIVQQTTRLCENYRVRRRTPKRAKFMASLVDLKVGQVDIQKTSGT